MEPEPRYCTTATDERAILAIEAECFICGGDDDLRPVDCQSDYDGRLICATCRRAGLNHVMEWKTLYGGHDD